MKLSHTQNEYAMTSLNNIEIKIGQTVVVVGEWVPPGKNTGVVVSTNEPMWPKEIKIGVLVDFGDSKRFTYQASNLVVSI